MFENVESRQKTVNNRYENDLNQPKTIHRITMQLNTGQTWQNPLLNAYLNSHRLQFHSIFSLDLFKKRKEKK